MREHTLAPKKHQLRGYVRIGKFSTNDDRYPTGQGFSITIIDELSGAHICDVNMTIEAFGTAINSQADCVFELRPQLAGKRHEHKTEVVTISSTVEKIGYDKRRDAHPAIDKLFAPYEIDGWKARREDIWNAHRRKGNTAEVTFDRYVEV